MIIEKNIEPETELKVTPIAGGVSTLLEPERKGKRVRDKRGGRAQTRPGGT